MHEPVRRWTVEVGRDGEIMLPLEVRVELDLQAGDLVEFEPLPDDRIAIRKALQASSHSAL